MSSSPPIRIGTRASALARWQAGWVADALSAAGHSVELVPITTRGDALPDRPIAQLGERGVFTKELQRALLDRRIDVAVHSLKDLPTEPTPGLSLAAVPPRESPFDVLISRGGVMLNELPHGALVATGSLRRQSQLRHARADLRVVPLRGNVDTRLRKLDEGEFDAVVLAEAGLKRLGLTQRINQILPSELMMPAVGQGALGLEARDDDAATRTALAMLDDPTTHAAVIAERSLLAALGGGCLAPIGAWARPDASQLRMEAVVLDAAGTQRLFAAAAAASHDAITLGRRVAADLLDQGAASLIGASRA